MHHLRASTIEAHVKICVLALPIARVAERATGMSWAKIRHTLDQLQATEYAAAGKSIVQTNQPPPACGELLKKLEVSPAKRLLAVLDAPQNP